MKAILLKRIKLEGFYGQTRDIEFSSNETIIRGDVKLGKTTIINAFTWGLLGVDLEGRTNYMLYDQSVEYSRDNAGQVRVEIILDIDGSETTIARTAKQKWQRDKANDMWVKAPSDEYKYYIDDLELTKGEFDTWIATNICPIRELAMIVNIDQWRRHQWRTLREFFQSIVGEITASDFTQDYSDVLPIIQEVGIERARQEFQNRANKYEKTLEKLQIEEDVTKRGLIGNDEINVAEQRIKEINNELDELDRRQSSLNSENSEIIAQREKIATEITVKERLLRDESETYTAKHNAKLRELRDAYNNAVATNKRNESQRKFLTEQIESTEKVIADLELQRGELRTRYKEANAKLFDGICPTCGSKIIGDAAKTLSEDFTNRKKLTLSKIEQQGVNIANIINRNQSAVAANKEQLANLEDVDEKSALAAYQLAEQTFIPYAETERGKSLAGEIEQLREQLPKATWADDVSEILHRKGELRIELQKQHEIYGQKLSNERVLERIENIKRERRMTVQSQTSNAKTMQLIWEYERELAEIIRIRANSLFPDRTEVIMTKYKKNGDVDFDVCQVQINGKDATATNTADRMNAGIDISTVFMRYHQLNFPLFIDGAESNTAIETYGRQTIKTVVDETCKTIKFDLA